jgi:hypothetical protein
MDGRFRRPGLDWWERTDFAIAKVARFSPLIGSALALLVSERAQLLLMLAGFAALVCAFRSDS